MRRYNLVSTLRQVKVPKHEVNQAGKCVIWCGLQTYYFIITFTSGSWSQQLTKLQAQ